GTTPPSAGAGFSRTAEAFGSAAAGTPGGSLTAEAFGSGAAGMPGGRRPGAGVVCASALPAKRAASTTATGSHPGDRPGPLSPCIRVTLVLLKFHVRGAPSPGGSLDAIGGNGQGLLFFRPRLGGVLRFYGFLRIQG